MTTITLLRTRIEVPHIRNTMRGKQPSYRWTTGYYVVRPDNVKLYPPMRRKDAYALAREYWPGCSIEIKDESQ